MRSFYRSSDFSRLGSVVLANPFELSDVSECGELANRRI
jgi:hypothetical protein